jgi:hypothetical protein
MNHSILKVGRFFPMISKICAIPLEDVAWGAVRYFSKENCANTENLAPLEKKIKLICGFQNVLMNLTAFRVKQLLQIQYNVKGTMAKL